MAEKKKQKPAAFAQEKKTFTGEIPKKANEGKGKKSAAYQPRDADTTSGHDVQKSVEEPAIEKPVKQPAPKIDKSNAVNFHITDDALGAGSAKEKFRRNIEAIRTLEKVESENRIATLEEQQILSQYVGWGGLADAFDESKSAWAGEYQQLKELLSSQELSLIHI